MPSTRMVQSVHLPGGRSPNIYKHRKKQVKTKLPHEMHCWSLPRLIFLPKECWIVLSWDMHQRIYTFPSKWKSVTKEKEAFSLRCLSVCQSHFLGTTVKEKQVFQHHSDETGSMCAPCAELALLWRRTKSSSRAGAIQLWDNTSERAVWMVDFQLGENVIVGISRVC